MRIWTSLFLVLLISIPPAGAVETLPVAYHFHDHGPYIYRQITDIDLTRGGKNESIRIESNYRVEILPAVDGHFGCRLECLSITQKGGSVTINPHNLKMLNKGERWYGEYDRRGKLVQVISDPGSHEGIAARFIEPVPAEPLQAGKPRRTQHEWTNKVHGLVEAVEEFSLKRVEAKSGSNRQGWIEYNTRRANRPRTYVENVTCRFVYDEKKGRMIRGETASRNNVRRLKRDRGGEDFNLDYRWTLELESRGESRPKADW